MQARDKAVQQGMDKSIVLVVDDNPETLHFVTAALESAGMTVLVALDGESALNTVEQMLPDVILLDALMPGMDGFETCKRLKAGVAVHTPIIFMTGLNETEHIVKGLESGGIDYLTKPISPNELLARMRVHLRNARQASRSLAALDHSAKPVLSVSLDGELLWATPAAQKLMNLDLLEANAPRQLPEDVVQWLTGTHLESATLPLTINFNHQILSLRRLQRLGNQVSSEHLLTVQLAEGEHKEKQGIVRLQQQFALTLREAEVLFWISRGKSNRDVADILGISPRTVNKHLEHVYVKQGVESRSAATALAIRLLGEASAN